MLRVIVYRTEPDGPLHCTPELSCQESMQAVAAAYRKAGVLVHQVGASAERLRQWGLYRR